MAVKDKKIKSKNPIVKSLIKFLYKSPLERNLNMVLRYGPIVKKLKYISKNEKDIKVLEVGSGTIGITRFYDGEVIGVDVETNRFISPNIRFLKSSACILPFKDNSFDVVLSVDTLEHLSRKDQLEMVRECFRVSKKHLFITYPIGFNKYHEKMIKNFKKSHLTESLKEHLEGGTATGKEVQSALKGKKFKISEQKGTHPRLAYHLNYLEQYLVTRFLSRTLLKLFLPFFRLSKGDVRKYFFVTKKLD